MAATHLKKVGTGATKGWKCKIYGFTTFANHCIIHLSIIYTRLVQSRVTGICWSLSQLSSGESQGYTLDRSPVHCIIYLFFLHFTQLPNFFGIRVEINKWTNKKNKFHKPLSVRLCGAVWFRLRHLYDLSPFQFVFTALHNLTYTTGFWHRYEAQFVLSSWDNGKVPNIHFPFSKIRICLSVIWKFN